MSEEKKDEVKMDPPKRESWDLMINGTFKEEDLKTTCNSIRMNVNRLPIIVYIGSQGGNVQTGLVINDVLESLNVPITWIHQGYSGSMGVTISQRFNQLRLCYSHSRFLCHGVNFTLVGSRDEMQNQARLSLDTEAELVDLYSKSVGLPHAEVKAELFSRDHLFSAQEALELGENGLVDGIIIVDYGEGLYLCKTRTGVKVIDAFNHTPADIVDLPLYKAEE